MHWLILLATALSVAAMMVVVAVGYCMLKKMPTVRHTETRTHFVEEWKIDRPECKNYHSELKNDHPELKNYHPQCKNDQLEFKNDHQQFKNDNSEFKNDHSECQNGHHVEVGAMYTASSTVFQDEDSTREYSSDEPVIDDRPRSSMTIGVETLREVGLSILHDLLLSLTQKHLEANGMRSHDDLASQSMTSRHDDLESTVLTSGHDNLKSSVVTSDHDDLKFAAMTSGHDDLESVMMISGHNDLESTVMTPGHGDLESEGTTSGHSGLDSAVVTSSHEDVEFKVITSGHDDLQPEVVTSHEDLEFKVITSGHDDLKPEVVTFDHGTSSDDLARLPSHKQSNGSSLEHEPDAVNCGPFQHEMIPGCDCEEAFADDEVVNTDGNTTYDYKRDQMTLYKLSSLSSIAGTDAEEEHVANMINVLFVNDSTRRESFLSTMLAVRCTRRVQLITDTIFRAFRLYNCVLRHWGKEQEAIDEDNDSGNVIYKINFLWNSITFSCITTTHGIGFIEATAALVNPGLEYDRNPHWSECVAFKLANNLIRKRLTYLMPDSSDQILSTPTDLDTRHI